MEAVGQTSDSVLHDVLVVTVDSAGTITLAEGVASDLMDVVSARAVGRPIGEVTRRTGAIAHAARSALKGEQFATRVVGAGGAKYEVRGTPRRREDGRVIGALVVATRSTHAKSSRSAHSDITYARRVFDHLPGAVWAIDTALRITDGVGHILGNRPLSNAIGGSIETFLGTTDANDIAIANHRAALAGETRAFRYEFGGRWYEVGIEPRHGPDGRVVGAVGVALDVTARQRAEQQLVESEQRLSEAQAVAHLGTWEWDVRNDIVTWSDELFRIYGLTRESFDGTFAGFASHLHPDDVESTRATVEQSMKDLQPVAYDHRIVRSDGTIRMLHTRSEARVDADGHVERLLGCCWDVTDRWNANRAVEESAALLRSTLESTADGILVVDVVGKVRACNSKFAAMWRIDPALLATGDDTALLEAVSSQLEDPESFNRRVSDLYAQPDAESFDAVRFADGRTFERLSTPHCVGDRIVGRVWSFRDVTERERLLRHAIFLADASRLLASLEPEAALEAVAQLAVPAIANACAIDLASEDGSPRRMIAISQERDGQSLGEIPDEVMAGRPARYAIGARSQISVPLSARGRFLGAITFAARERRTLSEEDLRLFEELARRIDLALENARLYRQAQEALKAREEFLSIAAHEIRGPITSLHLAAQLLQKGALSPEAAARSLGIITREDERLARFVDELLDVARIRTGQLIFHFSRVDLTEVVRTVAQRLAPDLLKAGSSLSVTAPSRVEGTWDRSRVDQIVTNLLSNAIKFGLARPIEIAVSASSGTARLIVADRGIGIAIDRQSDVFHAFERAVSARHYGGLGLGLYIVQTIVEGLGGSVVLKSRPDEGTTVTVELPQERPGAT